MNKKQSADIIRTKNKQLGWDGTREMCVRYGEVRTNNSYPEFSAVRGAVKIVIPWACLVNYGKTKGGRVQTYIFGPNGLDFVSGGNVYDAPLIQGSTMFGDAWKTMLDGGPVHWPDEMKQTAEEALKLWQ